MIAPRDLDELLQRLNTERAHGYAVASEELEIGLTSVSTPIRDRNDTLIAVINVSGPTSRLIHRVDDIAKLLLTASAAIKHNLQSTRPPTPRRRR